MKTVKNVGLIVLALIMFSLHSCEEEVVSSPNLKSSEQVAQIEKGSVGARLLTTVCDITGPATVCANQSQAYTFTTDIPNPTITWSVVSGSITLVSGQGTSSATFQFGSGFTGGSIQALGSNGEVCSETLNISAAANLSAPTITALKVSGPGEPTDYRFTATVISGVTYNWYVNGALQQSGPSNTFDWYFPCNTSRTVKCKVTNGYCTSPFSNSITKTGGCDRT